LVQLFASNLKETFGYTASFQSARQYTCLRGLYLSQSDSLQFSEEKILFSARHNFVPTKVSFGHELIFTGTVENRFAVRATFASRVFNALSYQASEIYLALLLLYH
jgi:hypothetical protein